VYDGGQVRRGFSIYLVLFFALGPLTVLLPASDSAALPACCRRDGAHHCAMYMHMMAARMIVPPGAPPIAKAPSHCPYYPQHPTVLTGPVYTVAVSTAPVPALRAQALVPAAGRTDRLFNPVTPLAGRGPPAIALA
jgi:hypothetical protein